MNKFIVRLPGGNQAKKDVSKPKQTNNPKCQSTQAYLDLGQKSLGTTKKCVLCSMLYVIDDEDDVRSHTEFCKKVYSCGYDIDALLTDQNASVLLRSRQTKRHRYLP